VKGLIMKKWKIWFQVNTSSSREADCLLNGMKASIKLGSNELVVENIEADSESEAKNGHQNTMVINLFMLAV
jgi:hypothetical protein